MYVRSTVDTNDRVIPLARKLFKTCGLAFKRNNTNSFAMQILIMIHIPPALYHVPSSVEK